MSQIHDSLHRLAMTFLRTAVCPVTHILKAPRCLLPAWPPHATSSLMQDTREVMLRWLAHAIEANVERSKSMVWSAHKWKQCWSQAREQGSAV